jgi:hypothetical protein
VEDGPWMLCDNSSAIVVNEAVAVAFNALDFLPD